jgi:hypothetical protein
MFTKWKYKRRRRRRRRRRREYTKEQVATIITKFKKIK